MEPFALFVDPSESITSALATRSSGSTTRRAGEELPPRRSAAELFLCIQCSCRWRRRRAVSVQKDSSATMVAYESHFDIKLHRLEHNSAQFAKHFALCFQGHTINRPCSPSADPVHCSGIIRRAQHSFDTALVGD